MTSEMLSGPDLGGGFLFQLSLDREKSIEAFTYHAQDGGMDAGGPPKGSPEPLEYSHPDVACQFGGPRCWHRTFRLPSSQQGSVRVAYNRTRFVMATLIDQLYDGAEVPLLLAIEEVGKRLTSVYQSAGIRWRIVGEAAAWLRKVDLHPNRIPIVTTQEGVRRFASEFGEYLTEPAAPTVHPPWGTVFAATAFVVTLRSGVRVQCICPPTDSQADGLAKDASRLNRSWDEYRVERDGIQFPVESPP